MLPQADTVSVIIFVKFFSTTQYYDMFTDGIPLAYRSASATANLQVGTTGHVTVSTIHF